MDRRLEVMEQIVTCERCELHAQCTSPVPFHGPTPANIAIVGEAPGKTEDEKGQPFIGAAGQMIRKHLIEVGLDPEEIFWVNTAQCYPHGTPTREHIIACADNKQDALELADPTYVLLLGKIALSGQYPGLEIKRMHGHPFICNGRVNFPTYHPAAALRNRNYERALHEDLEVFAEIIKTGEWITHISDQCAMCPEWGVWYDDDGLPLCVNHAPEESKNWLQHS